MVSAIAIEPVRASRALFGMSRDAVVGTFTQPQSWREYLDQTWFVARVSWLPAVLIMIAYSLANTFVFNILLSEFSDADISGAGMVFFNVNQIGPLVTLLVAVGARATAMCTDSGAGTTRDELAAQPVMGPEPVQRSDVQRPQHPSATAPPKMDQTEALTSVYVDWRANGAAVRRAVAGLPKPAQVNRIDIDDRSMTEIFGCRIAVELTGTFDQHHEGPLIARTYARHLCAALGVPAYALHDLLRADPVE